MVGPVVANESNDIEKNVDDIPLKDDIVSAINEGVRGRKK